MADKSNDNTSTLKAVYDSATGAAQSAMGTVFGSSGDQVSSTYLTHLASPGPPPRLPGRDLL